MPTDVDVLSRKFLLKNKRLKMFSNRYFHIWLIASAILAAIHSSYVRLKLIRHFQNFKIILRLPSKYIYLKLKIIHKYA